MIKTATVRALISAALIFCLIGCSNLESQSSETTIELFPGLSVVYDLKPVTDESTIKLFNRFLRAYVTKNKEELESVLADSFVWHVHDGVEHARGATIVGVSGLLGELSQRELKWRNVQYSDVRMYASGNRIFQEFRVTGTYADGVGFDSYGVDIYLLEKGKIGAKDSYWKRR